MTFGDNYHHFSHIEPFAPKTPYALLPYCYGAGQQDGSGYSLAKEGWPRHQVNGPVPLKSADRHERSECEPDRAKQRKSGSLSHRLSEVKRTTPAAPFKGTGPFI